VVDAAAGDGVRGRRIALFALVSVFVSNPFQSEPRAGVTPNYWHVMFLHGLLISLVGLGCACRKFGFAIPGVSLIPRVRPVGPN